MAWLIHGRELSTAQKNYVRGQSSALIDPVPDFNWIHGIKTLCCFGIGYFATVGAGVQAAWNPSLARAVTHILS